MCLHKDALRDGQQDCLDGEDEASPDRGEHLRLNFDPPDSCCGCSLTVLASSDLCEHRNSCSDSRSPGQPGENPETAGQSGL